MKKVILTAVMLGLLAPAVLAKEGCSGDCPMKKQGKQHAAWMEQNPEMKAKMQARRAEKKARKAQMRQSEEQIEKLVKEYHKAKGKKQEAKKAEIMAEITKVRDQQLVLKQEVMAQFKQRMAVMEAKLQEDQKPEATKAWVAAKTQEVIDNGGDLEDAMESERHMPEHSKMMRGPAPEIAPAGMMP